MTTVTVAVATGADDGYGTADNSTFSNTNTTINVGWATAEYRPFVRLSNVAVPAGVTVVSATLTVTVITVDAGAPALDWYGCAQDNPTAPATSADVNSRPLTTAKAPWSFTSTGDKQIDVTAAVAEVLARPGWTSGNALLLLGRNTAARFNYGSIWSFDHGSSIPKLTVTYTVPVTSQDESGGSTATVTVTVAANGAAAEAATAGSTATVTVTATGGGHAVVPFTVTATVDGPDVVLTWDAPAGATGYAVERDGDLIAFDLDALTYTDTPDAGEHTYRVGVIQ